MKRDKGYCDNCGWWRVGFDFVPSPFGLGSVSMEAGECQCDDPMAGDDFPVDDLRGLEGNDFACRYWKEDAEREGAAGRDALEEVE